MAYEISHKSQTECLIKYVVDDTSGGNFWLETFGVGFAVLALLAGIDFVIIIIGVVILAAAWSKAKPRRTSFEIELNRKKKTVSVKSDQPGVAALRTYPLKNFKGLGFEKSRQPKGKKKSAVANLFFEFDDDIEERFISAKNSLLGQGKLQTEPDGEVFWQVPIQKIKHHTSVENAKMTIASVEAWLGPKVITQGVDEPAPIMRDLRELENRQPK